MAIKITNPEGGRRTRALKKALSRQRSQETPLETAARLRAEMGIRLSKRARVPFPRAFYDELSGEV